ncbi:MAG TPA: hypothetical protein VIG49_00785 [Acetobacteraceae bacterium]
MREIGAEHGNIGIELCQNRFGDTQRLPGFLIRAGQQVFVTHRLSTEHAAKPVNEVDTHRSGLLLSGQFRRIGTELAKDGGSVRWRSTTEWQP